MVIGPQSVPCSVKMVDDAATGVQQWMRSFWIEKSQAASYFNDEESASITYLFGMFSADFEPKEANRRRSARSPIALNAELDGSRRTLCRVADISIGGVRLKTYSALKVGAKIWLTLPLIGRVSAVVKWADDYNAGCQFDEPVNSDVIEALLAGKAPSAKPPPPERGK